MPDTFKAPAAFQLFVDVRVPADRGDPPYVGQVRSVSDDWQRNHKGEPYQWVTVRNPETQREAVWPSNRLERAR